MQVDELPERAAGQILDPEIVEKSIVLPGDVEAQVVDYVGGAELGQERLLSLKGEGVGEFG